MGKDEGDGNGAVIKGRMNRVRDERNGIECADDLLEIGDTMGIRGQTHAKLQLHRENEDSGVKGRDSICRNYALWSIDSDSITFWESLDVEASRASIRHGGKCVGYGPGKTEKLNEYKKTQLSQIAATGAALEFSGQSRTADPNPKQRASVKQKEDAKAVKEESKARKLAKAEAEAEAAAEEEEARNRNELDECGRCGRCFLSKGWFLRHRRKWCRNKKEWRESRRKVRDVAKRLGASDALLLQKYQERIKKLGTEVVILKAPQLADAAIGVELEESAAGCFTVSGVSGLALNSAGIAEGMVAVEYKHESAPTAALVTNEGDLAGKLSAGKEISITFHHPVPIPYHGSARYGAHKRVTFKMHPEQKRWLEANVFFAGMQRMRPVVAFRAMKATFCNTMRTDTMTPMWLEKDQIAKWISDQNKEEKQRRRNNKKSTDAAGKGAKRKAKAVPPAKKKQKATSSDEDDADDEDDSGMDEEEEEEENDYMDEEEEEEESVSDDMDEEEQEEESDDMGEE